MLVVSSHTDVSVLRPCCMNYEFSWDRLSACSFIRSTLRLWLDVLLVLVVAICLLPVSCLFRSFAFSLRFLLSVLWFCFPLVLVRAIASLVSVVCCLLFVLFVFVFGWCQSLEMMRAVFGADASTNDIARCLINIGNVHLILSNYEEALRFYTDVSCSESCRLDVACWWYQVMLM